MDNEPTCPVPDFKNEVPLALTYYVVYVVYLFFSLENEFLHWLTMVIIPFGFIYLWQTRRSGSRSIKPLLSSFGLEKANLRNGLFWAILIGLLLSFLQLFLSRDSERILLLLKSGKFAYLFPLAFVLMLFTAGFTEEFFF